MDPTVLLWGWHVPERSEGRGLRLCHMGRVSNLPANRQIGNLPHVGSSGRATQIAQRILAQALTIVLILPSVARTADPTAHATQGVFATPLGGDDLDPKAFTAWVDGKESPVDRREGPRSVIWTQTTRPEWDGVGFGQSKTSGPRYLRIGWNKPVRAGTILVRGTVQVSVLRPEAAYPGNFDNDADWIAAQTIRAGQIGREEPNREQYSVWVLPPSTLTRAIRFTHTA